MEAPAEDATPFRPLRWTEAWIALILFAGLGIASLIPVFVQGQIFFPLHTDQINPWRSDTSEQTLEALEARDNPVMSDKHFLFHPDTQVAIKAFEQRRLPLWNPHILGGAPYLGQALYGVFYPVHWLLVAMPSEWAYGWITAIHVALAGFFTFLFLRRLGLGSFGALTGGVIFALGGPMAARAHYYMTVAPAVSLPLLLLLVDEAIRHRRRWALWMIAPVIALGIFTGFPQVAIYGAGFTLLWAAYASVQRGIGAAVKNTSAVGFMIGLGVALSAVQILPVLAAQGLSTPRISDPAALIRQGLSPFSLATFVVSDLFGHPSWAHDHLMENYVKAAYLPLRYADNFTETAVYIGLLPIVLAALAPVLGRGRGRFAFLGFASLALVFAMLPIPDRAPDWCHRAVGFVAKLAMGDPKRMHLPASLFLASAAAMSVQGLVARRKRIDRVFPLGLLLSVMGVLVFSRLRLHREGVAGLKAHLESRIMDIFGDLIPMSEALATAHAEYLGEVLDRALLLGGVALFAMILISRFRAPSVVGLVVTLVILSDLLSFGWRLNRGQDPEGFLRPHPLTSYLQQQHEEAPFRFARWIPEDSPAYPLEDSVIVPNMGTHFGLHDAGGYIVQVVKRYGMLFDAIEPGILAPVKIEPFRRPESLDSKILDIANVRFVITRGILDREGYRLARVIGPYRVYENIDVLDRVACFDEIRVIPSLDRLVDERQSREQERLLEILQSEDFAPKEELVIEGRSRLGDNPRRLPLPKPTLESYEPERIEVSLEPGRDAYLYLADNFYPGWKVEVDGKEREIQAANGSFRAVHCHEGARHVVFEYRPQDVRWGALVSVSSFVVGLALWFRGRSRTKSDKREPSTRDPGKQNDGDLELENGI